MSDPRAYAAEAHAGQTYGSDPYTVHLEAVAAIVRGMADPVTDPGALEAVAWLHDVVEDTPVTPADLSRAFGPRVAAAVSLLTDPEGETRRERKTALHRTLAALDPSDPAQRVALLVKAADRLANVRACAADHPSKLRMYRREHAAFREACRRPGLCDDVWEEIDRLLGE